MKAGKSHFDASSTLVKDVKCWTKTDSLEPTYQDAEPFLRFIDKYVKLTIGGHYVNKWIRMNRNKTLLDKLTSSDIAYTILVCENSKEVWDEEIRIKKECHTRDEMKRAPRMAKQKYHEGRGKRLKRYEDGWTTNGVDYYKSLCETFKTLKAHHVWNYLQVHWSTYKKTHYETNYEAMDEPASEYDNEELSINEDQWAIDVNEAECHEGPPPAVTIHCEDNDTTHRDKRCRTSNVNYFEA